MDLIIKAPKINLTLVGTINVHGKVKRGFWSMFKRDPVGYTVDLENGILAHQQTVS